jgi:hypothetical protein
MKMNVPRLPAGRGRRRRSAAGASEEGYAVLLVVLLTSVALLTLAGALGWCTTNATLNQRNNQYFRTVAAAEAATEKVLSHMMDDYQRDGDYGNFSHQSEYTTLVPTAAESSLWSSYVFSDGQNNASHTYVHYTSPSQFCILDSQYRGLYGYASNWRIISNARELGGRFNITAAVRQDLQMATIPLFQFAIFYNMDLEINPGAVMSVSGPVHANTNIYLQPQATLTFQSDVTSAGHIIQDKMPGDPTVRSGGSVVFQGEHDNQVSALTLPIGTNNSPAAVHGVVEIPSAEESPTSLMGAQRYYNKADLVIKVTSSGKTVTSGLVNNFSTPIPASQYTQFLRSDVGFFNKRENKTVNAVQLDVGALKQWNQTNTLLRPVISGGDIRVVYVDDQRTQTSGTESGVRLVNGQTLLPQGLTVATPEPLYVQGHYNCPSGALGTTNTSGTKPASLIGDAITVLSTAWSDGNSTAGLSSRIATSTTVNAAFLAGIVPTVSGSYSGGVENFPRFLEDWSSKTFTYNGSMVVMFPSQYATGPWQGTGSTIGIYNPPNRSWAFDQNFRDPNKLPPGTPQVRALVRGLWAMVKPNSVAP